MQTTMRCVYCELPEIKERAIIKNEHAWAFPTNIPVVPGHLLICPIRCVSNLEDLTELELIAILDLRSKLSGALKNLFDAQGFNYAWNEGKVAGQNVPHFHLHMLPRKEGDTGVYQYEPRKFLYRPGERETTPEEELRAVAEQIKKMLN